MTERWSAEAKQKIAEIAAKNGFSQEAGLAMAEAITRGVGSMAQFNHRDLGGQGQWVKGGMLMVADMFNDGLKARVRALAEALAEAAQRGAIPTPGDAGPERAMGTATGSPIGEARGDTASPSRGGSAGTWWPADLGQPGASGAQNGMRYAVFPAARRVAVERGGKVTVHDSGDHRISGVSQQQGSGSSLSFSSQHGDIGLDRLPELGDSRPKQSRSAGDSSDPDPAATSFSGRVEAGAGEKPQAASPVTNSVASGTIAARLEDRDPLEIIRKLAELRDAGILTEAEFAAKKTELLARI